MSQGTFFGYEHLHIKFDFYQLKTLDNLLFLNIYELAYKNAQDSNIKNAKTHLNRTYNRTFS